MKGRKERSCDRDEVHLHASLEKERELSHPPGRACSPSQGRPKHTTGFHAGEVMAGR